MEQVTQFKYLGSIISSDGYCEKDIMDAESLWGSKPSVMRKDLTGSMNLDLKKKIVKCTVWSIVLYGAETWTVTRADKERLEAFEMWIWRRMLKISWIDKVPNAEVLQKVQEKQEHVRHCTTS